MLDDHSKLEPPDPIPNSEVKRLSADGSVGPPHVRVGHRQASKSKPPIGITNRGFLFLAFLRFGNRFYYCSLFRWEVGNLLDLYVRVMMGVL